MGVTTGTWQQELVSALRCQGVAVELKGSALRPETLDGWSDADLGVQLEHDRPAEGLVGPLWAYEEALDGPTQVLRTVLTDGRRVDLAVTGARLLLPALDAAVNDLRFLLAMAAAKLGRGDRLIGSHLVLEAMQLCLVQAMLLRDRDEGTAVHRYGTGRDAEVDALMAVLGSGLDVLDGVAALFDRWHGELDPTYVADWEPLRRLVERGLG